MAPLSAETPADITVLDSEQIREAPGDNLDERLREVPGFSLFRRSSSMVAHPTTQGVSLRGIGSSGASRTLVLWDGIPENDPFGGWLYWTRFIPLELERVEVSRGASTSLFGDRAMGGAIALFSRPAERRRLTTAYEGGNRNTHDLTLGYSDSWSRWMFSGFGRAYTTDGYRVTPEKFRGAVDRPASVRFATADVHVGYRILDGGIFFKIDGLDEGRHNGTVMQHNTTRLGEVSLHYAGEAAGQSVSLLVYHTRETFRSAFSAIAPNRNTETPTYTQRVPSNATGGAAFLRRGTATWNFLAGADANLAEGWSTDSLYPSGQRVGGGRILQHGVFGQGDMVFGPARIFAGLRHSFTGTGGTFTSPSVGATLGRGVLRARASFYRSFRAPTLNELFRDFRVGNAVTQANPDLGPESVRGGELGLDMVGERKGLRLTYFRNSLRDLITNQTISTAPNLIVRQRVNAASASSRGLEAQLYARKGHWRLELNYLYVDSHFGNRLRVPQVPRNQGSGQAVWMRKRTMFGLGIRSWSAQFDDDLNMFRLAGYATVQMFARQGLSKSFSVNFSFENLLDHTYYTGFTPTPMIGGPRLWRIGLLWEGRLR